MHPIVQTLRQHNRTARFNELVYTALREHEPLDDVHVITMKGEFAKKIEMAAVDAVIASGKRLNRPNVMVEMDKLFASKRISVREAVYHTDEGISVVVNTEVIDDEACVRVFELVQKALYELDNSTGKVKFGKPVSFAKHEIPWLNLQ